MPSYHVKRCFLALPLDEVAIADLADLMSGVQIEGLRPTRPENLHVTLKFLGDVDDPDLPGLIGALQNVAQECQAFELSLTEIAYLPTPRRPRVLAAAMDRPPPMIQLFNWIEEAVADLGFPREGRAFNPHITLGRFRNPPRRLPSPAVFQLSPTTIPVDRFVLMQSTLGGQAPTYAELAGFPLQR